MDYGLKVTNNQLKAIMDSDLDWYFYDFDSEDEICFSSKNERDVAFELIKNIK